MPAPTLRSDAVALRFCELLATQLGAHYAQTLPPGAIHQLAGAGRAVCSVGLTNDGSVIVRCNATGAELAVPEESVPSPSILAARLRDTRRANGSA